MPSTRVMQVARRLGSTARAFATLPWPDQLATLRVVALLLFVETCIRWVSLPRLASILRVRVDFDAPRRDGRVSATADVTRPVLDAGERRNVQCVHRVLKRWPFGGGPCLRQSLITARLLRRRQPVLRIGVARSDKGLLAHAWIELDGVSLDDSDDGFVVLRKPFGSTS